MRQQPLTGYLLHQRPYQENRSLMIFFSQEVGVIHGVGKKNLPLFMPIQLLATGKNQLKTFSQSQPQFSPIQLTGRGLYVGFYLNELLVKLLPVEESFRHLWQYYQQTLQAISQLFCQNSPNQSVLLKWHLRQFEHLLIENLGYAIDFNDNFNNQPLQHDLYYQYQWQQGFVETQNPPYLTGQQIQLWQNLLQNPLLFDTMLNDENIIFLLNQISPIYRQVIDNLLNHQPLKSRELWQQFTHFST